MGAARKQEHRRQRDDNARPTPRTFSHVGSAGHRTPPPTFGPTRLRQAAELHARRKVVCTTLPPATRKATRAYARVATNRNRLSDDLHLWARSFTPLCLCLQIDALTHVTIWVICGRTYSGREVLDMDDIKIWQESLAQGAKVEPLVARAPDDAVARS
jgi:hypothetical protein